MTLACRALGHRPRFWAENAVMHWECDRGCGFAGEKHYGDAEAARRYAAAFDRDDRADIGRRSLLSLLPLRLARRRR
jgi:hypothetical protein